MFAQVERGRSRRERNCHGKHSMLSANICMESSVASSSCSRVSAPTSTLVALLLESSRTVCDYRRQIIANYLIPGTELRLLQLWLGLEEVSLTGADAHVSSSHAIDFPLNNLRKLLFEKSSAVKKRGATAKNLVYEDGRGLEEFYRRRLFAEKFPNPRRSLSSQQRVLIIYHGCRFSFPS